MAVMDWARNSYAAMFDNATAKRDYRTQMRSPRSVWLWAAYLGLMILVVAFSYGSQVQFGNLTVVDAQARLQEFYQTIMLLLACTVALVAPALAATSVVGERERRSLDLIFSAPVRPMSFLIGKLISAYRYTWLLLVLALPATSVCVVLGGATWSEVLASFFLLSLHGLIYAAIALLVSAASTRPVTAVVWSYVAVGVYSFLAVSAMPFTTGGAGLRGFGGAGEAPFTVTLSPFYAIEAANTYTTVSIPWATVLQVPNWALSGVFTLFLVNVLLLGAASSLSTARGAETKALRITGLVAVAAFEALFTWQVGRSDTVGAEQWTLVAPLLLTLAPLSLVLLLPMMAVSGRDGSRRFLPDGWWSMRGALRGTPSGALPYLVLVTLVSASAVALVGGLMGLLAPEARFLSTVVWLLGLWTFLWSLGRLASSFNFDLKTARVLHLALLMGILGLPVPILMVLDPNLSTAVWYLHPFHPLWAEDAAAVLPRLMSGAVMAILGFLIARSRSAPLAPPGERG